MCFKRSPSSHVKERQERVKSASRARQPMKKNRGITCVLARAFLRGTQKSAPRSRNSDIYEEGAKPANAKVAFLRQFGSGLPKTMKTLLAARCRSAYFPRMATIPPAHLAICDLQENCKSPPFSETTLFFIHLKRCTIEILCRQRHF